MQFVYRVIKHLGYRLICKSLLLGCRKKSKRNKMRMKCIKRLTVVISRSLLLPQNFFQYNPWPYTIIASLIISIPSESGTLLQLMSLHWHIIIQNTYFSFKDTLAIAHFKGIYKWIMTCICHYSIICSIFNKNPLCSSYSSLPTPQQLATLIIVPSPQFSLS